MRHQNLHELNDLIWRILPILYTYLAYRLPQLTLNVQKLQPTMNQHESEVVLATSCFS